jgi:hypothetical protein
LARNIRKQPDPHVLGSREAYGMTDSWQEYLCLAKTPEGAFRLFVGGYPPRSRKMRECEYYEPLVFTENDGEVIQDWLAETGWSSQKTVASIKTDLKNIQSPL